MSTPMSVYCRSRRADIPSILLPDSPGILGKRTHYGALEVSSPPHCFLFVTVTVSVMFFFYSCCISKRKWLLLPFCWSRKHGVADALVIHQRRFDFTSSYVLKLRCLCVPLLACLSLGWAQSGSLPTPQQLQGPNSRVTRLQQQRKMRHDLRSNSHKLQQSDRIQ
jgi:hypothetical protein